MKMEIEDTIEWVDAECTCECGCNRPTQVISEEQKLNNQCWECHYKHR